MKQNASLVSLVVRATLFLFVSSLSGSGSSGVERCGLRTWYLSGPIGLRSWRRMAGWWYGGFRRVVDSEGLSDWLRELEHGNVRTDDRLGNRPIHRREVSRSHQELPFSAQSRSNAT